MLTAIYQGLGYEQDLELVDFSTISLGNRINSLVKSSTTFKSKTTGNLHQGIWVDESAVVGTAQSVVMAVKSWLADNLSHAKEYENYKEACSTIANMDGCLKYGRRVLSDYVLQQREVPLATPAKDYLTQEVIEPIENIQRAVLGPIPALSDWYGVTLERKYCQAHIACARSCHIEGHLIRAAEFLEKAAVVIKKPEVQSDIPLTLQLQLEQMLHNFYGGQHDFIKKREWRGKLHPYLEDLHEYIYKDRSNPTQQHYCGRLDTDVYRCVSEIFARLGRLDFVFSTKEEVECLSEAAEHLLTAAYYTSKIGEKQRTAHWLANASRAYCRIGNGIMAHKLTNIAERILRQAIDQRYSSRYKEAIMAEVYISRGEYLLLIQKDPLKSLELFSQSFQGATYLGFSRLIADSLYDISRGHLYLFRSCRKH